MKNIVKNISAAIIFAMLAAAILASFGVTVSAADNAVDALDNTAACGAGLGAENVEVDAGAAKLCAADATVVCAEAESAALFAAPEAAKLGEAAEGDADGSDNNDNGASAGTEEQDNSSENNNAASGELEGEEPGEDLSDDKIFSGEAEGEEPDGTTDLEEIKADGKAAVKNPFEEIYQLATEYCGDIFSALSFIIGLIIALVYKKALIPGIKRLSASMKSSLDNAAEENSRIAKETEEWRRQTAAGLDALAERTEELSDKLEGLSEKLSLEEALAERGALKETLSLQIDMLYNLFIASAMPNYQKEELCKKMNEMKRAMEKNEK